MKNTDTEILTELKKMGSALDNLARRQNQIQADIHMIFSDLSCFENLMLKMMDVLLSKKETFEKYDQ